MELSAFAIIIFLRVAMPSWAMDPSQQLMTSSQDPNIVLMQRRVNQLEGSRHRNYVSSSATIGSPDASGSPDVWTDLGKGDCRTPDNKSPQYYYNVYENVNYKGSLADCKGTCVEHGGCIGLSFRIKNALWNACYIYTSLESSPLPRHSWYWRDHGNPSAVLDYRGDGRDDSYVCLKYGAPPTPSPPTPSPTAATPSPTAATPRPTAATNRMSGDPHVWFNGVKTTIHLPTDRFTDLFEQSGVAIQARGGPENEMKMNYMFVVAVSVDGREVARVEQEHGQLGARDPLIRLTLNGLTGHPKRGQHHVSSLHVDTAREKVAFIHATTGLEFSVNSRKTERSDASNSHHLNLRFGKGVKTSGVGSAEGALPQIWGTKPLAPDVQALIRGRSKTNVRDVLIDNVEDGLDDTDGFEVHDDPDGMNGADDPNGSDVHNGPDTSAAEGE